MYRLLLQLCSPANRHHMGSVEVERQPDEGMVAAECGSHPQPSFRPQSQLDYIVRQVHTEGFHVERISSFGDNTTSTMELAQVINDWAKSVNLKVGFNHSQDICVFEKD